MKAPDKIYVSIRDLQYGYTTDVCLSQEEGYSAYIRKDALLEWIEKEIQALSDGSLSGYYISLAYKDMIEHLNEMQI